MGLFKSMKDMAEVTKSAKQMQEQQQRDAGYKPGLGGSMAQMGDMLGQANEQLKEMTGDQGDRDRLLAEGIDAQGVIVGMGTPARGAQWFNLDIDLEVHVSGREAYRVANQYMVPASATLGAGVTLPLKVDPNDQAKIAIDWDSAATGPARGEVRAASGGKAPAPASSGGSSGGGDTVDELERLAKLRDSGALTDAEFEQQKARVLGG
jgi:hypothetical protein